MVTASEGRGWRSVPPCAFRAAVGGPRLQSGPLSLGPPHGAAEAVPDVRSVRGAVGKQRPAPWCWRSGCPRPWGRWPGLDPRAQPGPLRPFSSVPAGPLRCGPSGLASPPARAQRLPGGGGASCFHLHFAGGTACVVAAEGSGPRRAAELGSARARRGSARVRASGGGAAALLVGLGPGGGHFPSGLSRAWAVYPATQSGLVQRGPFPLERWRPVMSSYRRGCCSAQMRSEKI